MARIAGVDIPREKRAVISLTYLYGIGPTVSRQVLDACEIPHETRVRDLSDQEVAKLRSYIEGNLRVEGDLRREIQQDIKRKMEIGCYQGIRHRRGLPVRGQRTHTNARTRKGPKKTVAGKKKVMKYWPSAGSARTSPTVSFTSRARSTTRSFRSPISRAT